jgi:hypothetical protein
VSGTTPAGGDGYRADHAALVRLGGQLDKSGAAATAAWKRIGPATPPTQETFNSPDLVRALTLFDQAWRGQLHRAGTDMTALGSKLTTTGRAYEREDADAADGIRRTGE